MQPLITAAMSAGIAVLDLALVIGILALLNHAWRSGIVTFALQHGRMIVFLLSLLSVAGTLWMQYGDNLAPCLFCWWQRVFMYPIPIITGIAIIKNNDFSEIADYILGLSIFGASFALYQHLLQILPSGALIPCDASDACAARNVFEFGFVTIPWMAFTVFSVFIFIALVTRKRHS